MPDPLMSEGYETVVTASVPVWLPLMKRPQTTDMAAIARIDRSLKSNFAVTSAENPPRTYSE